MTNFKKEVEMLCERRERYPMECTSRCYSNGMQKVFQLVNVLEEMNELVAFVVLNDISNYYFCLLLPFLDRLLQHITCVSYGFKIHPSTSVMQPVILVS